jgi:hypothetical protein
MTAIILDEHRNLFRSDADFERFVSLLEGGGGNAEMVSIWANKRHLATLLSPAQTKTLVQARMLQRILERPSVLDEMRDRIEKDEIVD